MRSTIVFLSPNNQCMDLTVVRTDHHNHCTNLIRGHKHTIHQTLVIFSFCNLSVTYFFYTSTINFRPGYHYFNPCLSEQTQAKVLEGISFSNFWHANWKTFWGMTHRNTQHTTLVKNFETHYPSLFFAQRRCCSDRSKTACTLQAVRHCIRASSTNHSRICCQVKHQGFALVDNSMHHKIIIRWWKKNWDSLFGVTKDVAKIQRCQTHLKVSEWHLLWVRSDIIKWHH